MKPIQIGLLGFGTVGSGVANVLARNAHEISRRAGRDIKIKSVGVRNIDKARGAAPQGVTEGFEFISQLQAVVDDPEIDIICELIGGIDLARDLVLRAIAQGKHVVTANKALLAIHGNEIFAAAQAAGVIVAFEAAVAGGIPIIKAIREGLTANRIAWVAGIINGTSNYILSEMRERGAAFVDVLAEAQQLGYAELDPTFDIEGQDAAHKLTILAALAFGIPMQYDKAYVEGISKLQAMDMAYAEQLGYRIKLLGITRRQADGIELRVHPTLIPQKRIIANVDGVMNAVLIQGDAVGQTLYSGRGAGSEPTASAVVADVVDVARLLVSDPTQRVPHLAFQPDCLSDIPVLPIASVQTRYYLRLSAQDKPGVMADVTRILAALDISIDAMMQKEAGSPVVDVIILTHQALERSINAAIEQIENLPTIAGPVVKLRMESLEG